MILLSELCDGPCCGSWAFRRYSHYLKEVQNYIEELDNKDPSYDLASMTKDMIEKLSERF